MAGARAKSPASRPATSKIPNVAEAPAEAAKVSPAVTAAGWAYGLVFAGITAARISHETHLQSLYRDGLKMDSADVGSLWSVYYFWCAVCDPLVGIGIDILQARGIAATTLLVVFTPLWTYLMGHIWSPDSHNPTATTAVLLAFGLLQAMQLMLVSAVLGSVFPAGPCRQVASLARQMLGILGLLVGMVGPPYLSSDWDDSSVMSGPFVYFVGSAVMVGSLALASLHTGPLPASERKPAAPRVASKVGAGGESAGGAGALESLKNIFEVLLRDRAFRPVLLFSMAAQFGNALFASHVNLFLKHVARCTSDTLPRLCLGAGAWCMVPSLAPSQQRTLVVVAFYVAALTFGPALLARARKHGVVPILSVEFALYGLTLLCTPVVVCAVMSALGSPVFAEPVRVIEGKTGPGDHVWNFLRKLWAGLHTHWSNAGSSNQASALVVAPLGRAGGGARDVGSSSEAGFWSMLACSFLIGTAGAGISLLPDLVIAANVDTDEAANGRNRSGAYYGARQVCNRMGSAAASKVSGSILKLAGYKAADGSQAPSAQLALAGVGFLLPAVAYSVACAATLRLDSGERSRPLGAFWRDLSKRKQKKAD